MKKKLRILSCLLIVCSLILTLSLQTPVYAAEPEIASPSGILMEQSTGRVLYEKDADTPRRPASVTKIMTILLTYEAVRDGKANMEDMVTISANAAGYGGSTILLEEGEQITLENLVKGMCIASGNDAAIAAAEYIGGSQEQFVEMMNQRAQELGMLNTHFVNPCGLDADGHVTTARDIAIMSRELMMNFPEVTDFTTTWHEMMPHVWRSGPGETDMANTNHLIQSYHGMTGLKTGFTRLAKYSLSATATRNDMSLIAVIMGAETKDQRSQDVTALLDYGFGSFTLQNVETDGQSAGKVSIIGGMQSEIDTKVQGNVQLLSRKDAGVDAQNLQTQIDMSPSLQAPIQAGDPVGTITYLQDEEPIATLPVVAAESVEESTLGKRFLLLIDSWLHKILTN